MENNRKSCVICNRHEALATELTTDINSNYRHQSCPFCLEFKISASALTLLNSQRTHEITTIVSAWIFAQNKKNITRTITTEKLNKILSLPFPSPTERSIFLLIEAIACLDYGQTFYINKNYDDSSNYYHGLLAPSYSNSISQIEFLLEILTDKSLVRKNKPTTESIPEKRSPKGTVTFYARQRTIDKGYNIRPQAYAYLEDIKNKPSASTQAFVSMWFDASLNAAYDNGFYSGILTAGYSPLRIDRTEHINSIDDEMILQIKSSKFMVADFTGHRGGVYFEAGFALGLNIPIFWCCREDHVNDLHFDIRQFNCIAWKTPEDLAKRLAIRIESVLGSGPNKTAAHNINYDEMSFNM